MTRDPYGPVEEKDFFVGEIAAFILEAKRENENLKLKNSGNERHHVSNKTQSSGSQILLTINRKKKDEHNMFSLLTCNHPVLVPCKNIENSSVTNSMI